MREPPKKGSLRESLLTLLLLRKDYIEYARFRALAQIMIDKEKGAEAFEEFRKAAFPWVDTQKKREKDEHIHLLEREVLRGGLRVTPMGGPQNVVSRTRTKIVQAEKRNQTTPRKPSPRFGSILPI
jgi:hypothetical protein